jgi:hypothetical protein
MVVKFGLTVNPDQVQHSGLLFQDKQLDRNKKKTLIFSTKFEQLKPLPPILIAIIIGLAY